MVMNLGSPERGLQSGVAPEEPLRLNFWQEWADYRLDIPVSLTGPPHLC